VRNAVSWLAATALLGACVPPMQEGDCLSADWYELGVQDAVRGDTLERLAWRDEQCAAFAISPDAQAYHAGRAAGLAHYCAPANAFDLGAAGRPYQGICPAELEAAFLPVYRRGARLYDLEQAYQSALRRYQWAVEKIGDLEADYDTVRAQLDDPDLTAAARKDLRARLTKIADALSDQRRAVRLDRNHVRRAKTDLVRYERRLDIRGIY